uniref:Uncharacterized protein n=1 Tax=Oryza barthii TaxID=65489 RepID=A0A0D3HUH7_9ORYZ
MLTGAQGRDVVGRNPALAQLLLELRHLAYIADDVLDELDYFRIQDELEGTYETVDDAKEEHGLVRGLVLHARHTGRAITGKLSCSCAASKSHVDEQEVDGKQGRFLSAAAHVVGKRLPCCSLPSVHDDASANMPANERCFLCGAWSSKAQQRKHAVHEAKLKFDRVEMSNKMTDIVEQLKPVCAKVATILGLVSLGYSNSAKPQGSDLEQRSKTTPEIIEPELYGREKQKQKVAEDIINEYCVHDLTLLPVVGPGGIGKTTFVQHIYDKVKSHFQVSVWICVSQNFNASKLAQEIVNKIPKSNNEGENESDQERIEKRIQSKQFLLVLDDVWTYHEDEWKALLSPFKKGGTKGNMVIVTTRIPKVAEMVELMSCSIKLKRLQDEDSMELFQACVGIKTWKDYSSDLKDVGTNIVKRLKGFPLAVKTVGRLLRNQLSLDRWTALLKSKEWELQVNEDDIMPALKLSYNYLPFHLQQCFSCCALFPEDYRFSRQELTNFWIGLGLLGAGDQNKIIEDIGLDCLNDLVDNGFFEREGNNYDSPYVIHDLLHELATNVSSYEISSSKQFRCEVGKLIFLHELRKFEVKREMKGFDLEQIGQLLELHGSLSIYNLEKVEEIKEADDAKLACINHLDRLVLNWDNSRCNKDPIREGNVLERLKPHNNIRELHVAGHGGATCPNWLDGDFSIGNLQSLHIESVNWDTLPLPGKLYMTEGVDSGFELLNYNKDEQSKSSLNISGKDAPELQEMNITKCPPISLDHLKMLTCLKTLDITYFGSILLPVDSENYVQYNLPVEKLIIRSCGSRGRELTQVLSHLPKLSNLLIRKCQNVARLGVAEQRTITTPESSLSPSANKAAKTLTTIPQQQTGEAEEMETAAADDGLLLLPPKIKVLEISECRELSLDSGGIQGLLSLQTLGILDCPKFLCSSSSSSFPFLTSLQALHLLKVEGMQTLPSPLPNLTSLYISHCGNLRGGEVLCDLLAQGNLTSLSVHKTPNFFLGLEHSCSQVDKQEDVHRSWRLQELSTDDFARVLATPVCHLLSSSLTKLDLSWNDEVECFTKEQEKALHILTSIEDLEFSCCKKLQSLPTGLSEIPNIKTLGICNCPAITSLGSLPISLQELKIDECPAIHSLPKDGLPTSLREIVVSDCDNEKLERQCRKL